MPKTKCTLGSAEDNVYSPYQQVHLAMNVGRMLGKCLEANAKLAPALRTFAELIEQFQHLHIHF